MKKFYLTTAIDFVNAPPHLGHLYEKVCADAIVRYHRLKGEEVFFLTGLDENAQKNEQAAKEAGMPVKAFVDKNAEYFKELCDLYEISNDDFIRTTEKRHERVVKTVFQKIYDKGDIYKKCYEGYYCQGCEEFKTEKDLVDGKCPEHDTVPVRLKEENYFFKLSKYQDKLLKLLSEGEFVLPLEKRNEVVARLKEGLKDLSVTRPNLTWGIDAPIDPDHKIYVWIDALTNYISALGYPDGERFNKFWPADVHLIGKGINWFHSVIWPAILLSAGIDLPKLILVHGYITVEGEKMSKSKGTVVNPLELAKNHPIDSIRYFLLRELAFGEDGDFTMESLVERTNNELVANIGNFIHRTLTFISKYFGGVVPKPVEFDEADEEFVKRIELIADRAAERLERFELDKALKDILEFSDEGNRYFQRKEPWKDKDPTCLYVCANAVRCLAVLLEPFVPSAVRRLWSQLNLEEDVAEQEWDSASKLLIESGHKIGEPEILFKKI